MVFVVQYYLEEVGTAVQIIAKLCGTALYPLKKGKKFCKHSKGLEELAIEGLSWKLIDNSIIQMKI